MVEAMEAAIDDPVVEYHTELAPKDHWPDSERPDYSGARRPKEEATRTPADREK